MSKKYMQILCVLISVLLTLSVTANFSTADDSKNEKIVLVENGSSYLDAIKELGTEIIDKYNNYVLIKISEDRINEYENYGMRIDELKKRTTLHVKSHTFDFKEDEPDIELELKKRSYKKGTEGLYIVHMIGPINPEWRTAVEDKGVKVINYVPNYAYEVRMTPKQAQEIRDLFFVDWVGIYHPGYKLSENLEAGKISVTFINGETRTMRISNRNQITEIIHKNDVDYVNQYSDREAFAEMATQITGGGCYFWDPQNNATEPYRGDGNYGSLMNQLGYEGDGVTIAIADTGFYEHDDYKDRIIGWAEYDGEK